ncbi:sensor histidine kinase [Thiomicrorhabdus sp.]|uniref:sensor histidine kinase n=1 Tax=Thiomicrorhabdus sp. TaxID=2039724 RepID=UPI002AA70F79|nr:PhnD/SsuA/transferrin family substrate-binding protein [Thiomicrorhabdus sp.]
MLVLPIFNKACADTISIGVFNQHSTASDIAFWNKTANYLSTHIEGLDFVIKPMGRECLDNAVDKKQLQFIISSPNHLVQLVANGAKLIATLQTEYHGKTQDYYAATVIAKSDKKTFKTLSDLKNLSVVATSPFEFGGYQMMKREFMLTGITPDRDFFELRFTNGSQKNIVRAVLSNEAEAGIIRSGLLEKMIQDGEIEKDKIKIIGTKTNPSYQLKHSSSLYAEWGIATLFNTDVALSLKVATTLYSMPKSTSSQDYISHYGWTKPGDLTTVKGLLRALKLPPYSPENKINLKTLLHEYAVEISLILALILVLILSITRVSHINRKLAQSQLELDQHKNNLEQEVIERTQELSRVNRELEEDIKARESVEATLRRSRQALQSFYEISVNYSSSYAKKVDQLMVLARIHFQMDATFLYKVETPSKDNPMGLTLQSFDGDRHYEKEALNCLQKIDYQANNNQIQTYENTQCNKRLQSIMINIDGPSNRLLLLIGDLINHSEISSVDQELLRLLTQWIASGIERHAIEEEREIYRSQLGKITRLFTVGEMATGLAHEINQPLTAAVNYISGSLRRLNGKDSEEIKLGLTRSLESLNLASNIIKRLREFVQTGTPQQQEFDLISSINKVLDILGAEAYQNTIKLLAPSSESQIMVKGDKTQIEQVILNLVRNGMEAVNSKDGFVSIDLKILNHDVEVSVIDNGSGVNEQEMQNIFNAFHSSKTEGMGLGLAICRSIIEAHNSQLKIQNNHPGCQFMFTLPLVSKSKTLIEESNT